MPYSKIAGNDEQLLFMPVTYVVAIRSKKLTRRAFMGLVAALPTSALGTLGYSRYLEPRWIEISHKRINTGKWESSIKLAHLSDLHFSEVVPIEQIRYSFDLVLRESPDLICITGDFISKELIQPEAYREQLKRLSEAAPTFACIGNHDGRDWGVRAYGEDNFDAVCLLLKESGVTLLFNQAQTQEVYGNSLNIVGLGDLWSGDCKPAGLLTETKHNDLPLTILLSHNPDSKEMLLGKGWDIMLSGHTHGGQLVVPIAGYRPILPVIDQGFPEGCRQFGSQQVNISRGIGNLHGLRFNCRPEISMLEIS